MAVKCVIAGKSGGRGGGGEGIDEEVIFPILFEQRGVSMLHFIYPYIYSVHSQATKNKDANKIKNKTKQQQTNEIK